MPYLYLLFNEQKLIIEKLYYVPIKNIYTIYYIYVFFIFTVNIFIITKQKLNYIFKLSFRLMFNF
jgi:hypothetical protein